MRKIIGFMLRLLGLMHLWDPGHREHKVLREQPGLQEPLELPEPQGPLAHRARLEQPGLQEPPGHKVLKEL
jgi:hypothetical protein